MCEKTIAQSLFNEIRTISQEIYDKMQDMRLAKSMKEKLELKRELEILRERRQVLIDQ